VADARIGGLARWRAVLALLREGGGRRLPVFAALVVAAGLLPTGVILATGALVRAIPAVVGTGGARPALLALGALLGCSALLSLAGNALAQTARVLDSGFALEVHHAAARAALAAPGLAEVDDPAFADALQAVQEAERRGVLRMTATALSSVATTRLRGAGAFVVLLGFHWWAPLLLAAAWHLTNRVYLEATKNGVSVDMSDGAVRLRRAEYVRSLAVDAGAAKEVRVFGLGAWLVGRYGDAWQRALGEMWKSRRANRALTAAATVGVALSHAAVLAAVGVAVMRGEIGSGAVVVFVQAIVATVDLGMIGDFQWFLAQSMAVAERVAGLRPPAAAVAGPGSGSADVDPSTTDSARGPVAVRLDGVRFTYRGRGRPTLDGLTLDIPAGQSLAIVGENGAGKSTLIKLLCGLYEPDAGSITLDGGVSPLRARRRIGVIFQDFVRYRLPLRENVVFGDLPLIDDDAAVESVLRDAGGGELFAALPAGLDTVLSREFEGGADLSGGEWQRVALARALAAVRGGAGLLILDEPTASLDVRAETELFEHFLRLTRGVTTLLVSHRLSSVRRADRIVVIDGGRIVEDGSHDALMRADGRYARMYAMQAERFATAGVNGEAAHA
jgi:ATP-binding cassette subfamily B protein